jgi:hypothetical protein
MPDELARVVVECLTSPSLNAEVICVVGGIRMSAKGTPHPEG